VAVGWRVLRDVGGLMMAGPIETFRNAYPEREYEIEIRCPEYTAVCPRTGQPDFGEIRIVYVPAEACIELKSLKYYLQSYRNRGIFYETAVNQILDDIVASCQPRRCTVIGLFRPRGGMTTTVTATYRCETEERAGGAAGGGN